MDNLLGKNLLKNHKELELGKKQMNFLKTNFGRAVNTGIDFGLKVILPDLVEDEVISVKDALVSGGFKDALHTAIENAMNMGKSFQGIFSGNFESMSQIKTAVKKGGLIDSISGVLDLGIEWAKQKNYIPSSVAEIIKQGKREVVKSVKTGIDNTLEDQVVAVEKIEKYITKWKKYYNEQNFQNMEYQYKQINKYLEKTMPLENVLKEARKVKIMHELIRNNKKEFNLTEEQKNLIKMFVK